MNSVYKFMLLWCLFFVGLTAWRMVFLPDQPTIFSIGKSISYGQTTMDVSVVDAYYSYTKGFKCVCDVEIVCNGRNLVGTSLAGWRWDEGNNSEWCWE